MDVRRNEYEESGFWFMVWTRIRRLIGMCVSMKFLVFGISIALTAYGLFEKWMLFAFAVALISIKSFEKYVAGK